MSNPPQPVSGLAPDYQGPYDAENNGRCAYGHPVNGYGRCKPLNDGEPTSPPPGCPSRAERLVELTGYTTQDLLNLTEPLGITVPSVLPSLLHDVLVGLVLTAEGYPPA